MHTGIACVAVPRIYPRGARNAIHCTFTTGCWCIALYGMAGGETKSLTNPVFGKQNLCYG